MPDIALYVIVLFAVILVIGSLIFILRCYRKVEQGTAIIRTGFGGTQVSFEGITVIPILHRMEIMDISVKRIEIDRMSENGLICRDNLRADVKVAFFVRVNKTAQDVLKVAQSLGCRRASETRELVSFFDAKFSEALKTAGKQFDFVHLYTDRLRFKEEILKVVGTDLNGYALDDAAIDYLEQTPLNKLNPDNILDAEGIKKITELTAQQAILSNNINRERERTIKKQDVETREKVLELERQQTEAEQKLQREVAEIKARQTSQAEQIIQEERLKAERAKINTEEELAVAEENKLRQILVAQRNRERTDKVETERVEKDRQLEANERERVVTLSQIEKNKAVETEKRSIAEVIRERIAVERSVVEQEEKIKDTRAVAEAERNLQVGVIAERTDAEKFKVKELTTAVAHKEAARERAEQLKIDADARKIAAERDADARKLIADAVAQEAAATGISEARTMAAKAEATETMGNTEAKVLERKAEATSRHISLTSAAEAEAIRVKALAEAEKLQAMATAEAAVIKNKTFAEAEGRQALAVADATAIKSKSLAEAEGLQAKSAAEATAIKAKSLAEADGMQAKATAEADGITHKAEAMKLFHEAGREHEEFKLQLNTDLQIELAKINTLPKIASEQANILASALRSAKIELLGGESGFFERLINATVSGKALDRWVGNSSTLTAAQEALLGNSQSDYDISDHPLVNSSPDKSSLIAKISAIIKRSGIDQKSLKTMTAGALLAQLANMTSGSDLSLIDQAKNTVSALGLSELSVSEWLGKFGLDLKTVTNDSEIDLTRKSERK